MKMLGPILLALFLGMSARADMSKQECVDRGGREVWYSGGSAGGSTGGTTGASLGRLDPNCRCLDSMVGDDSYCKNGRVGKEKPTPAEKNCTHKGGIYVGSFGISGPLPKNFENCFCVTQLPASGDEHSEVEKPMGANDYCWGGLVVGQAVGDCESRSGIVKTTDKQIPPNSGHFQEILTCECKTVSYNKKVDPTCHDGKIQNSSRSWDVGTGSGAAGLDR